MLPIIIRENSKGIFIGDSNTDCGRTSSSNPLKNLGDGYVSMINSYLIQKYRGISFQILNRGVSGDTVFDLAKRWQHDLIEEKPDWISVAIGINDALRYPGRTAEFEDTYRSILAKARHANPSLQIVLCECYLVGEGPKTKRVAIMLHLTRSEDSIEELRQEVKFRNLIIQKLAYEFNAIFVPLEKLLCENPDLDLYPSPNSVDGIHPNRDGGHRRIADAWINAACLSK